MSAEENTRLGQSAYEAFGRGDMAALAEMMAVPTQPTDVRTGFASGTKSHRSGFLP